MAVQSNPDQLVGILRDTVVALVRRDGPDLSARQLGVFLTVYLTDGPHTVRGLAAELNVSKPAITRALDRLGELDLARRKVDPMDRRSVIVQRTLKGTAFLRDMRQIAAGLRLPELERMSVRQVAERAVDAHVRHAGSQVELDVGEVPVETPLAVRIALYRALQELLSNAARYGRGVPRAQQREKAAHGGPPGPERG